MFLKSFTRTETPAPFVAPVCHWPEERVFALCYPAGPVGDYLYLLQDGTLARVSTCGGFRVNFGDGWQRYERRAFQVRIAGRVVSLHRKDETGAFVPCGAGYDV